MQGGLRLIVQKTVENSEDGTMNINGPGHGHWKAFQITGMMFLLL